VSDNSIDDIVNASDCPCCGAPSPGVGKFCSRYPRCGDRYEAECAFVAKDSRDTELASLRERLAGVEEQSEARRRALLAVGDERRVEWTRAEKAESERDAALAKLAEAERKGAEMRTALTRALSRCRCKSLGVGGLCDFCNQVRAALATEGE
jgi:hypothetical protein